MNLWLRRLVRSCDKFKTTAVPMATKLGRMMTYLEWLLPIKSHEHTIMWSCKIMSRTKIIIYPLIQCSWLSIWAEFSFIKPPDPLILWSCKGTWIILPAVSLLPQDLWPLNLKKLWLTLKKFNTAIHRTWNSLFRKIWSKNSNFSVWAEIWYSD